MILLFAYNHRNYYNGKYYYITMYRLHTNIVTVQRRETNELIKTAPCAYASRDPSAVASLASILPFVACSYCRVWKRLEALP